MLKVSAAPAQDLVIERAVDAARELGVPEEAVALSAEEVAERCRSPVFRAASSSAKVAPFSRGGLPARGHALKL
jgi:hypothetical protein